MTAMKPKTAQLMIHLLSWWVICLLCFTVLAVFTLPLIGFFQAYFVWFNDPFNIGKLAGFIFFLIVMPAAQVFWVVFMFSLFDQELTFIKAFNNNMNEITNIVKEFENSIKNKRQKK